MIRFNVKDPKIRQKISAGLKGNKNAVGGKSNTGRKMSEEQKQRLREYWTGRLRPELSGSRNHNWKGGISKEQKRERAKQRRLKIRFEVLERDKFTCRYCGRSSLEAKLEIDHKIPRSKGGQNSFDNYITSCKECNLGKGDVILNEFKSESLKIK